jgi:2-dehydropantoate 2-reductase
MLQDVIAARKTEIDSLCGEVALRAERHGIPTPLNNQLTALIKAIEGSYGIR